MTFSVVANSGGTTMTYQWFSNSVSIRGATQSTYTISNAQLAAQATYYVNVINAGGTTTSDSAFLTVTGVAPTIAAQPQNQAFNNNDAATLSVTAAGTAPLSYQWMLNGTNVPGATNSTLSYSHINTNNAGLYSVLVSNASGVVTSSTAVVTVQAPPYILVQPQSQYVLLNLAVTFSVTGMSKSGINYQWYHNGNKIIGATSSSYTVLSLLGLAGAGDYWVVLSNPNGSTTSSVAHLGYVSDAPSILAQPVSESVGIGQSATFSVTATNYPIAYQWRFNGAPLPGATNSTLTLYNVQTNNAGAYSVVLTNVAGSVTSSAATLTVNLPASIATPPQSQTVIAGQRVTFDVLASGVGPLNYQWAFNGNPIEGATNSILTINSAQSNNAGAYTVTVSNPGGSVTSAEATLNIMTTPPAVTASGMTSSGFGLQIPVPTGRTYVIQASDDMVNWVPIYTNVAVSGTAAFTDPSSLSKDRRFYRVQYQ